MHLPRRTQSDAHISCCILYRVLLGLVVLAGSSGCSSPLKLTEGTDQIAAILIANDGEILGEFGNPAESAIATLSERIEYARTVIGDIDIECDPHNGRVLLASTAYDAGSDTPYSDSPKTIVWRDWLSSEDPVEFSKAPWYFVSESFVELWEPNPNGRPTRIVVDLSNPSNVYAVPMSFDVFDLLADGRWVATTKSELLSGKLGEGTFQIERRMPFLSASMAMARIMWVPQSRYVLIGSSPPHETRGDPNRRRRNVLLDWDEWRLVSQPEGMRLDPAGGFMLNEQPVFLAKPEGTYSRWKYAVISPEGVLVWSDWRAALPLLYDPQYVSSESGLILARQNSRLLLYPGASPRLRVSTLSPERRRQDLLKMSWESVAGWLAAPVETPQ